LSDSLDSIAVGISTANIHTFSNIETHFSAFRFINRVCVTDECKSPHLFSSKLHTIDYNTSGYHSLQVSVKACRCV